MRILIHSCGQTIRLFLVVCTLAFLLMVTPACIQGPAGPQGSVGPQGAVGPQGSVGPQGLAGPQGPVGPQGLAGPQGPVGPRGWVGPQGPAGSQGSVGPQGPVGSRGPSGPPGPQVYVGPPASDDTVGLEYNPDFYDDCMDAIGRISPAVLRRRLGKDVPGLAELSDDDVHGIMAFACVMHATESGSDALAELLSDVD